MKKNLFIMLAVLFMCSPCWAADLAAHEDLIQLVDQLAEIEVTQDCAYTFGFSPDTVGHSFLEAVVATDAEGCQERSPVGPFVREEDCKASQASASDPKTGCYYKDGEYYYDMILTVPCEGKCQERSQVGPFEREEDCQASQASASDPKTGCYYQNGKYYYDMILTVSCESNPDQTPPTDGIRWN